MVVGRFIVYKDYLCHLKVCVCVALCRRGLTVVLSHLQRQSLALFKNSNFLQKNQLLMFRRLQE